MGRKQKGTALAVIAEEAAIASMPEAEAAQAEAQAEAETDEQIAKTGSVVKAGYKLRYKERARTRGDRGKAARRSNWDWLAQTLAANTLDKHAKIDIEAFLAILDANGVDHSRWQNRSKGWEGRLRMTGRLALQRVVAEAGVMRLPDGDELVPPTEWVEKHLH